LLTCSKLHPVFHISVHKQHMGIADPIEIELPDVPDSRVQPQAILEQRMRKGELEIHIQLCGIFSGRCFVGKTS